MEYSGMKILQDVIVGIQRNNTTVLYKRGHRNIQMWSMVDDAH